MFLLVTGRAQRRSRVDEPIRTQRDRSSSGDQPITNRPKRRVKESDSSNNYPIIVGPLTTNQDLKNANGEKIYNLPLMIQQPFLREKKEPIKVDISVKLIPKPKKKERRKRDSNIDICDGKGVKNNLSMEVVNNKVHILNETVEVCDGSSKETARNYEENTNKGFDSKNELSTQQGNRQPRINNKIEQEEEASTDLNKDELHIKVPKYLETVEPCKEKCSTNNAECHEEIDK